MRGPSVWTPHTVTVAPYLGEGANGPVTGPSAPVVGVYVKDQAELVYTDLGKEEVSRATVWFPLEAMPANGSKVTVWPGTGFEYTANVFKTSRLAHPAFPNFGKVWLR